MTDADVDDVFAKLKQSKEEQKKLMILKNKGTGVTA
jgi:hypothetical protein